MPLTSEQAFRDTFNFRDASIDITGYLDSASSEIRAWVGADVYAGLSTEGSAPEDVRRARRLALAETYLSMHYAYPILATQVESGTVVLADRSEGDIVRQFPKPKEMAEGARVFYDQAAALAAPYMVAPESAVGMGGVPFILVTE